MCFLKDNGDKKVSVQGRPHPLNISVFFCWVDWVGTDFDWVGTDLDWVGTDLDWVGTTKWCAQYILCWWVCALFSLQGVGRAASLPLTKMISWHRHSQKRRRQRRRLLVMPRLTSSLGVGRRAVRASTTLNGLGNGAYFRET